MSGNIVNLSQNVAFEFILNKMMNRIPTWLWLISLFVSEFSFTKKSKYDSRFLESFTKIVSHITHRKTLKDNGINLTISTNFWLVHNERCKYRNLRSLVTYYLNCYSSLLSNAWFLITFFFRYFAFMVKILLHKIMYANNNIFISLLTKKGSLLLRMEMIFAKYNKT